MRALPPILLLVCLCVFATPTMAQRVNRCTGPDGTTVFSDRRCEDIGATDRLPPPAAPGNVGSNARGLAPPQCVRRLSVLVQQIRSAVDARDVNRLSALYWWNGVSDDGAQRIFDRLEAIVRRPLVAIVPVLPDTSGTTDPAAGTSSTAATTTTSAAADADGAEAPSRPHPTGLRLQQTLAGSITPASTVLDLRRQYDCFWISF
ncbi:MULTISPECIES: DUF4124 domain-containing protein [Xanthomonas]|uniref:DUF4124 domain-containing protein n=1 Tax=Xanthomonas TaxID=338 RepID=UPI001ADD431C|nr:MULTISPECIES: DUF4124 domain-containing protein [unclassified Xanthomonas]MBO9875469.1 DUF4124 domain-containing protein [Xanthomonas sp. D-93]WNH44246.1 DUF4124 domain-containing protein [Xanthomonas sp. A6251]